MAESVDAPVASSAVIASSAVSRGEVKSSDEETQDSQDSSSSLVPESNGYTCHSREMDGRLVEESTFLQLVPSLEKVAKALKSDAGIHDIIVAVLTVIMREAGFWLDENTQRLGSGDAETLDPSAWKSPRTGCYELRFKHDNELLDCKIVGVPVGDILIINLCPPSSPDGEQPRVRCATFQTLKYVNPYSSDVAGRFMNLRELSHRFKDSLTTPMKGDILTNAGISNASLAGLPIELKLRILNELSIREISRIAQTSREFRDLCADQQIWHRWYMSIFEEHLEPYDSGINYRDKYIKSHEEHHKFCTSLKANTKRHILQCRSKRALVSNIDLSARLRNVMHQ